MTRLLAWALEREWPLALALVVTAVCLMVSTVGAFAQLVASEVEADKHQPAVTFVDPEPGVRCFVRGEAMSCIRRP